MRFASMVERIEDPAGFEKLRDEWDELLEESASNCLFLTWEWLHTWWRHLGEGRQLSLIAVRCEGRLIAVAPLTVRPRRVTGLVPFRVLEFLGTGSVGSDYLDLIIRRGREREAIRALVEHLADGKLMLELAQVNRHSCLAAGLATQLMLRGWRRSRATTDICPFIRLSGHSWQSYLATLGAEHRYNFGRRLRNLTKRFDVRFERVAWEEQRRTTLSALFALHDVRWRERGGSTAFCTPGLRSFHEEVSRLALQRGWLRLFVLRVDGKPAAALYGFAYGRTFYFYQAGFDPCYTKQSVGLVTLGLAIQNAIEEGVDEFDLLHGDEQYKLHWAREARELERVELYPPRVRGLLYEGAVELGRAARRLARRVLPNAIVKKIETGGPIDLWKWRTAA
ncbi:MAG: GNAT family N-acetyltransferase [Candidatus Rokubacteria bacterium]|nr:GNAT family N-acetyltransferase [Candidatus Rokubacteria bacterium]